MAPTEGCARELRAVFALGPGCDDDEFVGVDVFNFLRGYEVVGIDRMDPGFLRRLEVGGQGHAHKGDLTPGGVGGGFDAVQAVDVGRELRGDDPPFVP